MKKIIVPIIAFVVLSYIGCVDLKAESEGKGPFAGFFAVHMEAAELSQGKYQEKQWPNLVKLVEMADRYNAKLTLMFNPQWAEYISKDNNKLNLVKNWQENGHEIALHYHNISHRDWNGYTNRKDVKYTQDPRYRGTVEDMMKLVNKLAEPEEILTTTMGPDIRGDDTSVMEIDETDYPDGIIYDTEGFDIGISKLKRTRYKGREIYHLKHCLITLDRPPKKIKQESVKAGPDDVVGVVTHEINFGASPDLIEEWFKFCQDRKIDIKTVREIAARYPKDKIADIEYIPQS